MIAEVEHNPDGVRLQKLLSQAGVASRRGAEELIRAGQVTVDGRKAVLGERVDPARSAVAVGGKHIVLDPNKHYFAFNKPAGVMTTRHDPEGRTTIYDVLGLAEPVLPVGRLDAATEGLLLLTTDGELTHRMLHPSYEIPRTYLAEVKGQAGRAAVRRLVEVGVDIGDGVIAKADSVKVVDVVMGRDARSLVELVIHEGRKHEVRRMLAGAQLPVVRLVRTQFGPLRLGRLGTGSYRRLSQEEVAALYRAVGL